MNSVLQQVDDWLMTCHQVETDHGGDDHKYIGFELNRHNRYDNVLFVLNGDTILAWYADPFISGDFIATSPHGDKLDAYLLRTNERLGIGRWSRTVTGDLLFDVSVPINGMAPSTQLLSHIFEVACDAFDLMISRVRLLLDTGLAAEDPRSKVYTECINFAANDPSLLPRLEALGLVDGEAALALRKIMNMSDSPWSVSLQEQTREAIDEMRVSPDGLLHFKHKTLGYGSIKLDDLVNHALVLRPKNAGADLRFEGVQGLLNAGWAID